MRAELSPRQRIYLLWTFRNFRQLSIALLNQRQRTLVIDLFRNNAGIVSPSDNPSPVIGVVENFVPPPIVAPTMPSTVLSTVPVKSSPTRKPAQKPVETPFKELDRTVKVMTQRTEVAPVPDPVPSSSSLSLPCFFSSKLEKSRLEKSRLTKSRLATSRLATAMGALSLCIISVVAWQRVQVIPSSQAHNQPGLRHILLQENQFLQSKANTLPDAPNSGKSAAQPIAAREVAVMPASAAPVISRPISTSTSTAVETPTPAVRVHHAPSTPNFPLSGQNSGIQASRPPLHFAYPDDVHARGVVALTAGLDSDGSVQTVRIVSGNPALAAAAIRAVRHWRYRPYLKDGQPVATETNIVISFFNDAVSVSFPSSFPASH